MTRMIMTTTIERPGASPTRATGAPHPKLSLIALLASVYVFAWWAFGVRVPARSAEPLAIAPGPEPRAQRPVATWYQDLPPSARPPVQLPAGWHIAGGATASFAPAGRAAPVPVRVSPARPARIRTRSS